MTDLDKLTEIASAAPLTEMELTALDDFMKSRPEGSSDAWVYSQTRRLIARTVAAEARVAALEEAARALVKRHGDHARYLFVTDNCGVQPNFEPELAALRDVVGGGE